MLRSYFRSSSAKSFCGCSLPHRTGNRRAFLFLKYLKFGRAHRVVLRSHCSQMRREIGVISKITNESSGSPCCTVERAQYSLKNFKIHTYPELPGSILAAFDDIQDSALFPCFLTEKMNLLDTPVKLTLELEVIEMYDCSFLAD